MSRPRKWKNPVMLTVLIDQETVKLIDKIRSKMRADGLTASRGEVLIKALSLYQKWGISNEVQ